MRVPNYIITKEITIEITKEITQNSSEDIFSIPWNRVTLSWNRVTTLFC